MFEGYTWRLSDLLRISGGFSQGMMGLDLKTGFNLHNDIK